MTSRGKRREQKQAQAMPRVESKLLASQGKTVPAEALSEFEGKGREKKKKDENGGRQENGTDKVETANAGDLEAAISREEGKRGNSRKWEEAKPANGNVGDAEEDDPEATRLKKKKKMPSKRSLQDGKPADGGVEEAEGDAVEARRLRKKEKRASRRSSEEGKPADGGVGEVEGDDLETRRLKKKEKRANRQSLEEGKPADGGVGEVGGDKLETRRLKKEEKRADRKSLEEGKPADGGAGEADGDELEMRRLKKKEKRANRKSLEECRPAGGSGVVEGRTDDHAAGNGKVKDEERTKKEKSNEKKKQKSGVNRWGEKKLEHVDDEGQGQAVEGSCGEDVEAIYEKRKILVGGIPYSVSEDDIVDYFAPCGNVEELDCVLFPDTGKFRGLAFITFETEAGARAALELDGADMGGRYLKIQRSKVKEVKAEKPRHEQPPQKHDGCTSAYIGNLAWDVTEEEIRDFFRTCKITGMRFAHDKATGEFRGFGHLDFADDRSLETAIALDQQVVHGRPIKIAYAVPHRQGNQG